MQTRLLQTLSVDGEPLFLHKVAKFWTPHSPKNFLPSAAAALDVPKPDRDMLGGWAAEESDRYARVSKYRIMHVQRQVARTFSDASNTDPLHELETFQDFAEFLKREGASEVECSRYLNLLSKRAFVTKPREEEVREDPQEEPRPDIVIERDEEEEVMVAPPDLSRVQIWNMGRSAALGSNPKEARERLRSQLDPGFYVSTSTFRNLKILHRLGACYLIPGVDYQQFEYLGTLMPERSKYEQICKLFARGGTAAVEGSSCSQTTSSSESVHSGD